LGAQNFIKDIISGFFIIVEDQYMVGDYIQVGELQGFVNEIGLRMTRLTDWGGEVHLIPNGQIERVTNHSRANRQASIDVRITYSENLEQVMEILNQVVEQVKREFEFIKEGPTVLGIVEFGEATLLIRIVAMTEPMRQWELERVVRARIKQSFEMEGIKLPSYPGSPWVKGD
jgi:small conductance mechanosensitive channel